MTAATETALWFLNSRVEFVIPSSAGEDRLSILKHWVPYADSPPLHIHDTEDEVFHVIEGQVRFILDGEFVEVGPGDTVIAPKGKPHTYVVDSADGAHFMTITHPGDFEAMVRAAGRPADGAGMPEPVAPTPEMAQALGEVCARHGIRLIGAPLEAKKAA